MSSSSEVRFRFPESPMPHAPGPLEKLWQSAPSSDTMFLSAHEVQRREQEARAFAIHETELRLHSEHQRELAKLRHAVSGALSGFEREREQYLQAMEKQVVKLSLAIAHKVIGRELEHDPALLAHVVKDVLTRLKRDGESMLRVSPAEISAWESALAEVGDSCQVKADSTLSPGRCVLETPLGSTNLDPISELADIEEAFSKAARTKSPDTESGMVQ